jgi:hypothetical protein
MNTKYLKLGLIPLILAISGCGNDTQEKNKTMLLGWYLTGSDLESGDEAGTSDLLELVKGYTALTKQQQETLDIQVVFGGADKDGWKGVKYADINCIIQDAKDEKFGNDSCYIKEDLNGNMGNPETIKSFIGYLDGLGNYDKRMLNFWNHGGAYSGVCFDENHKDKNGNNDGLTLNELKEVFEESKSSFDIIGMDACLMANYSVAQTVKNYATYLLASEETEPGHGWQYTDVITAMGTQSDKDIETIGKKIVDSFIDNPDHNGTNGKTLSLIDLKKVSTVTDKFDSLHGTQTYSELTTFKPVVNASLDSTRYGVQGGESLTHDFYGYLEVLSKGLPDANSSIQPVKDAIKESIVYSRYQNGMEGSHGMSIANVFNSNLHKKNSYQYINTLSNIWKETVDGLIDTRLSDTEPPVISNFEPNCIDDESGETGTCMHLADNTVISKIRYNFFVNSGSDSYIHVNSADAAEKMENGDYFIENQESSTFMLCNESEECNFLLLKYDKEIISDGIEYDKFTMRGLYNGKDAEFTLYVDFNDGSNVILKDLEVTPISEWGQLGRSLELKKDDKIKYQLDVYSADLTKKAEETISVGPITVDDFRKSFVFKSTDVNTTVKVVVSVTDINNNKVTSPIF